MKKNIQIWSKKIKKKDFKYALISAVVLLGIVLYNFPFKKSEISYNPSNNINDKLTMTMVGDIMMGRNITNITNYYGSDYLFRYTYLFFENSDYVSGNFENTVLLDKKETYVKANKYIHLDTTKQTVNTLKKMGFTMLNLANNHMMDFNSKGLQETLQVLQENKLNYVGAGNNLIDAKKINYQNINGIKIASLGFTDAIAPGAVATTNKAGVLSMNPDNFVEQIREAKDPKKGNADLVIVNVHWGEEYDTKVNQRQQSLAKALVDAGADIIIGHHPHVLQSFEIYKNSIIFYSLGNFIFDQGWTRTKDSIIVQYHLHNDGRATVDIIPLQINEGTPRPISNWINVERIQQQLIKSTVDKNLWKKKKEIIEINLNHQKILTHVEKRK
ncbi:CapA family protein [Bacillus thuringiensis]|uniref:CapA family protein n=1 Tax=Bacillus thuringiensis TaxID=1428 RepID=UPI002E19F936|nr:CapA family protein [Bacillus thuringiensis]